MKRRSGRTGWWPIIVGIGILLAVGWAMDFWHVYAFDLYGVNLWALTVGDTLVWCRSSVPQGCEGITVQDLRILDVWVP